MNSTKTPLTGAAIFADYLDNNRAETLIFSSEQIAEKEYHAEKRFASKHALDLVADSPEKYRAAMDSQEEREPTPSMIIGSAFHCAVLEPEHFDERFCVKPENIDRRTKAGKEAYETWTAQNAGKDVLTDEQAATVAAMKAAFLKHPLVSELWKRRFSPEMTVLSRDESTGLPLKARLDAVFHELGIVVDVKTCASAHPDEFARACANFRYDVQAAFYLDLIEKADAAKLRTWNIFFVAIENKAPHAVAVYQVNQWLSLGRACYLRDIATLDECRKTGEWKGYSAPDDELAPPPWLAKQRGF